MADRRFLKVRRQGYYSQVTIPRSLRAVLGANPIIRSLATRDLTVAQRRRWAHVADAREKFDRTRRAGLGDLSPIEIEERAQDAYERTLREAEADKLDDAGISVWIDQLAERIEGGKLSELEQAEAWASVAALNGRSAALQGRLYRPPAFYGRRGIDRLTLRPLRAHAPTPDTRAPTTDPGAPTTDPGAPMTFSAAASRYLEELQRDPDARLTRQAIAQGAAVHRLFVDFCQDAPLSDITRPMASTFLDTVSTLHPHWGRAPSASGATLDELVSRYADGTGDNGLSNTTINRYAHALKAVFAWAERRGHYAGNNPFDHQTRRQAASRATGWLPFKPPELVTLLGALRPVYDDGARGASPVADRRHTARSALAWITWIAAYSGMRLEEACSLDVDDVRKEDGVWFFDVTNAKTAAGDRRVPVHSVLIKIGLLEYRARLVAMAGEKGALWPALRPGGPDGKRGLYVTRLFTWRRRELGLTRARLSFHSLRKNTVEILERSRVHQSEVALLVGHERGFTFGVYSPLGLDLRGLQKVVEKIEYKGVKV